MHIPNSKSQSDRELWLELRKGNKEALRTLFLRHHDSLYQYGLAVCSEKSVIEDCLQELFFQLWNTHQQLSEVSEVKGYLWICFRRRLMKQIKKNNRRTKRVSPFLPGMKKQDSIEKTIIHREEQSHNHEVLTRVVDQLSQREREVLYLKFYEGMSYSEIEKVLGVEYQTARNYVYRAINRLREVCKEKGVKIVLSVVFMLTI